MTDLTRSDDLVQYGMDEVIVSEFKAKCIRLMKQVRTTKKALTVTLRGEPLVVVEPVKRSRVPKLGTLTHGASIQGNIVNFNWSKDWDG